MKFSSIETNRLILREICESDINAIYSYASDPEVVKYLTWGIQSKEETINFVNYVMETQDMKERKDYYIALLEKQTNDFVGTCGIFIKSFKNSEATIGYWICRAHWGKAYALESSKAMLKFGFNTLNLHRIFGTCEPNNISSLKTLEKLGMTKEGFLRKHKKQGVKWRDSLLYSILDSEY